MYIREEVARLIVARVYSITTNMAKLILEWTTRESQLAAGYTKNSVIHITMATSVSGYPVFVQCKHKRLNHILRGAKLSTPSTSTPNDPYIY